MLLQYLYNQNPYEGFPHEDFPDDVAGFRLPESVLSQIATRRPARIIEVGSWKGRSAIYMADLVKKNGFDCEIVCIDTWLGAQEMWKKPDRDEVPERYQGLKLRYGYPNLYYQFLANVIKSGHQSRITPFPNTSAIGARLLAAIGYQADFIFIDGSHDYDDALGDFIAYWPLLKVGGVMVGDDYSWVVRAVNEFSRGLGGIRAKTYSDEGWLIEKKSELQIYQDRFLRRWARRKAKKLFGEKIEAFYWNCSARLKRVLGKT